MNILKGNVNINIPAEVVQIALKDSFHTKGRQPSESYSLGHASDKDS